MSPERTDENGSGTPTDDEGDPGSTDDASDDATGSESNPTGGNRSEAGPPEDAFEGVETIGSNGSSNWEWGEDGGTGDPTPGRADQGGDDADESAPSPPHQDDDRADERSGSEDPSQTAGSDRSTGVLEPPQRTDPTEQGAFSMPNYARDLLNFEFVLEENDAHVPDGVNGAGMVVVDEDEKYVGIARVEPRSWSIHTEEKKSEIVQTYKSAFLATLDFPVQIVSYPTKFDISDHVSRLEEIVEGGRTRASDSQLVNIGRHLYPNWLERFILDNDMKQRQFYVVVPVDAEEINDFQSANDGLLASIADSAPPLEPIVEAISGSDGAEDVTRQQCLRELESRISRVSNALRRLDVDAERVSDRDEVLGVLYHYYNNEQPMHESFPKGPYSVKGDREVGES